MEAGSRKVIQNSALAAEVRRLVKSHYGDDYDGAMIATCEAALWVSFDALFTPPFTGRGDNYRARYLAPYERHMHHQAGYGRPFPPQYKDLYADRGAAAGKRMGHAGAIVERGQEAAAAKIEAFRDAGVRVAELVTDVAPLVAAAL